MEKEAKRSKQSSSSGRRSLKRKLGEDRKVSSPSSHDDDAHHDLAPEVRTQAEIVESTFSSTEPDRASAKRAIHVLSELAKNEHQQLIVDAGALTHLVDLLKRHKTAQNSCAVNGVIRIAADAITNLAHENSSIKTRVRIEGGIPPHVELLEFPDAKVQRAS